MFQRLKGAIDSRIAEEQARQRSALNSTSASSPSRKPRPRAESPAQPTQRSSVRDRKDGESLGKGPDPSEFDPEFVIGDVETPSRSGTPRSAQDRSENSMGKETTNDNGQREAEDKNGQDATADGDLPPTPSELPMDVRSKLRKLEKLESRYHGKSYRIAHSRVVAIEPFEATLRENTPLTSINDPAALVEYLNQLNLKGDMVVDELKRVSSDRDSIQQRLSEAERNAREAWDEVTNLRQSRGQDDTSMNSTEQANGNRSNRNQDSRKNSLDRDPLEAASVTSPPVQAKSGTGSTSNLSIFSPKSKPTESPAVDDEEEFFSYDNEIPRLEAEVRSREEKIDELQSEIKTLKGDLSVTRESTQSMVQTLEEATREVNNLRDSKDRSKAEFDEQKASADKLCEKLKADLNATEQQLKELKNEHETKDTDQLNKLRQQLEAAHKGLKAQQESVEELKDSDKTQTLQDKLASMESELAEVHAAKEQDEKRIQTLNHLVHSLREQLDAKDAQVENKQRAVNDLEVHASRLKSDLDSFRQTAFTKDVKEIDEGVVERASVDNNPEPEPTIDSTATSKKKNKKKKKSGKTSAGPAPAPQAERSAEIEMDKATVSSNTASDIEKLNKDLMQLRAVLLEKDMAIDRLHGKLRDQDGLKEEIESLRDDLINMGQEHVDAKDRVKLLTEEKKKLQSTIADLENELMEARGLHASSNVTSEEKHQNITAQFEDLKTKAATLQTDLSAAQQLASSRFKDLSDLRSMLQKAQPELTSLRSEVADLKPVKDALKQKEAELKKVETKNSEIRTELMMQRRSLSDKDSELKSLQQRFNQEKTIRLQAEEAKNTAVQDTQRLENERRQASEAIDRLSKDLVKAREEMMDSKGRLAELEQRARSLSDDNSGLKEEIDLKTAQYASAQSLMSSMRDQTAEMAIQMKEARERCENLDEEVADAHRLLSERSREGETMRRLLADVEIKTDARTREIKERLDTAIEERDRAEDEASTAARRKARELEEFRSKLRDAERALKRAEEDRDELQQTQRDWKRRREELESTSEQSTRELAEVRKAMVELRDALDESERQARDLEKQKGELRRSVEETQHRLEKLQKSNKASHALSPNRDVISSNFRTQSMADEIRTIQATKSKGMDSEVQSSRSSIDSTPSRARLASPMPKSRQSSTTTTLDTSNGQVAGSMDFVYLKNVLLQFLEQKDKSHQKQLIPVLGMLLHFDRRMRRAAGGGRLKTDNPAMGRLNDHLVDLPPTASEDDEPIVENDIRREFPAET
ncbi:MAG: hypothetical protein Q9190_005569 [Brigantiaea leucoxantha]